MLLWLAPTREIVRWKRLARRRTVWSQLCIDSHVKFGGCTQIYLWGLCDARLMYAVIMDSTGSYFRCSFKVLDCGPLLAQVIGAKWSLKSWALWERQSFFSRRRIYTIWIYPLRKSIIASLPYVRLIRWEFLGTSWDIFEWPYPSIIHHKIVFELYIWITVYSAFLIKFKRLILICHPMHIKWLLCCNLNFTWVSTPSENWNCPVYCSNCCLYRLKVFKFTHREGKLWISIYCNEVF